MSAKGIGKGAAQKSPPRVRDKCERREAAREESHPAIDAVGAVGAQKRGRCASANASAGASEADRRAAFVLTCTGTSTPVHGAKRHPRSAPHPLFARFIRPLLFSLSLFCAPVAFMRLSKIARGRWGRSLAHARRAFRSDEMPWGAPSRPCPFAAPLRRQRARKWCVRAHAFSRRATPPQPPTWIAGIHAPFLLARLISFSARTPSYNPQPHLPSRPLALARKRAWKGA